MKPKTLVPLEDLLSSGIEANELADILDEIAINYARMALKEGTENSVPVSAPEQVYWLFELRNVFQEVNHLNKS